MSHTTPTRKAIIFVLPDGVESRLRFKCSESGWVAEFRVANRDFSLPAEHDLNAGAKRVLLRCAKPNRRLVRHSSAAEKFNSLQALYNIKAAMAADSGDDADAALWSLAPWKLGVMTGLLVAFDRFFGHSTPGEDSTDAPIVIESSYVDWARKWN